MTKTSDIRDIPKIDVHHHWMPKEHVVNIGKYLPAGFKEIAANQEFSGKTVHLEKDGMRLFSPNNFYYDVATRLKLMDKYGVQMAVLSTGIWQEFNSMKIAPYINDELAKVVEAHPDRFIGLAHVPPFEEGGVDELDRAVKDLGFRGACITTNTDGQYPDSELMDPFFKKVNELGIPVFVHGATAPKEQEMLKKYQLRLLGRKIEHALAVFSEIFSGYLTKYPKLVFINGHLGGTYVILTEYIKRTVVEGQRFASWHGWTQKIDGPSLKRVCFDTAPPNYGRPVLELAVKTLGASQLLYGSDYPAQIDLLKKAQEIHNRLDPKVAKKIFHTNAERLFKVKLN